MILFRGIDYLVSQLQAQGLLDKTVIMIGSDFGRTPYYNDGNGKDHWNITSMMFMGAVIPGGRLVGATDGGFKAKSVDPPTLTVNDDPNGKRIQTNNIHRALRRLAKVDSHPYAQQFPLVGDDMPLFA
jgi:arylsulfatase A-like enzyme